MSDIMLRFGKMFTPRDADILIKSVNALQDIYLGNSNQDNSTLTYPPELLLKEE